MTPVYAYIRVSTVKQGTQGSSLQEQKSAIMAYASRNALEIREWFEERETAAKRGRPIFDRMLKLLARQNVSGVIIYKIDRSARNLRDWADLGELVDHGMQIHLAHESLDLQSRGGRLAADLQAVIAADFIRNLRSEVRKGFEGRLKQGLYPLPAPIGYVDQGRGLPKLPDPIMAPLVRQIFALYATGKYNLFKIGQEAYRIGLRNRAGQRVSRTGLSTMLNNPFYTGTIHIRRTGESYRGIHEPIVSLSVFKEVRDVLRGRRVPTGNKHHYAFRKTIACASCGYSLTGERQKGHVYYRCHASDCPSTCLKETDIDSQISGALSQLCLPPEAALEIAAELEHVLADMRLDVAARRKSMKLRLNSVDKTLERLTDGYLDGTIERSIYVKRKASLLEQRAGLAEDVEKTGSKKDPLTENIERFLELYSRLMQSEKGIKIEEKRELLKSVTSNLRADRKKLVVDWKNAFLPLAEREKLQISYPYRTKVRTSAKAPRGDKPEIEEGLTIAQQIICALESDGSAL